MSKVDAQRAMREARYAAYRASRAAADVSGTGAPSTPAPVPRSTPPDIPEARAAATAAGEPAVVAPIPARAETPDATAARAATQVVVLEAPAEHGVPVPSADPNGEPELCGHRNIAGKSCQRPAGHAERNHRYK